MFQRRGPAGGYNLACGESKTTGRRRTTNQLSIRKSNGGLPPIQLAFFVVEHGRRSWSFYDEARHGGNAEPNANAPGKIRSTALTGSFFGKVASQGRRQRNGRLPE
jgi:hypothetical protein